MSDPKEAQMSRTVVVALGGNALTREEEQGRVEQIEANAAVMAAGIRELLDAGWRVLVVHGNGPQVGNLSIQQEEGVSLVPPQPLYSLTAMTQGQLGSIITRAIDAVCGPGRAVAVVTHALVHADDPAFSAPTKPIGPFFTAEQAEELSRTRGWSIHADSGRGHRRVVASPIPLHMMESAAISTLLESDHVVLAAGGGGIPVVAKADGSFAGVDAVIDKDLAAARVGAAIKAQAMLLVTGVPAVSLDFGTPRQRTVNRMTAAEARNYLQAGQFPPGSMGPKVAAALDFVGTSARTAVITSADRMVAALDPSNGIGTHIVCSSVMSPA